jgi:acetamidase/formamidase
MFMAHPYTIHQHLCSVCGDLRISEIVDIPNWTVSFYFPRIVLD